MRWTWPLLLSALGIAGVMNGCDLVAGLDHDVTVIPVASTGGTGGSGGSALCAPATYPPVPTGAPAGGEIEFTTVMRTIDIGDGDPVGLDLDSVCTCHDDKPSCQEAVPHCDGKNGIDNNVSVLFTRLQGMSIGGITISSMAYSQAMEKGQWSVLFRVRNYNGMANDAQVTVDWYESPGLASSMGGVPRWDGTDLWDVAASGVSDKDVDLPLYSTNSGYVVDSVLVGSLPEANLVFSTTGRLRFTIKGVLLVARIAMVRGADPPLYRLDESVIAARWRLEDLFNDLSSFRFDDGKAICTGDPLYQAFLKPSLCTGADILTLAGPSSLPCDAISFGFGFTTYPARLGSVIDLPPESPGCVMDDPRDDSCN